MVTLQTKEAGLVRAYKQVLDLNDGSYLVRFRLYRSYVNLVIGIVNAETGQHVGESPFVIEEPVNAEKCSCPEPDVRKWYSDMGCKETYKQIEIDMQKFGEKIDMDVMQKIIAKTFNQEYSQSLCNYVLLNNQVRKLL